MSNKTNTAALRPRGRPFAKGTDPRRHVYGQRNKEAVRATKLFRDYLTAEGKRRVAVQVGDRIIKARNFEALAKVVWRRALKGEAAFVNIILDRVEGKVTQPFEGQVQGNVAFIMPRPAPADPDEEAAG